MVRRVEGAFRSKARAHGIDTVVGCGIGEILLKEAAEMASLEYVSVQDEFGEVSKAFPAYAIAKLFETYDRG